MGPYDDIINLEYPVPRKHPRMPHEERAKQFLPFAALRGFDDEIDDRQIPRETRRSLSEDESKMIDSVLHFLLQQLSLGIVPLVQVDQFVPDEKRSSASEEFGLYHTVAGHVTKIIINERIIKIEGKSYSFDDIASIKVVVRK